MAVKLAINGFGRIGRPSFKAALDNPEVEVVAINDLTDNATLAHLLKYDTVYGKYDKEVKAEGDKLIIDGKEYMALSEPDPEKLPWKDLGVDVVLECTGVFRKEKDARKHITAGAKMVILSAPGKEGNIQTYVKGVNDTKYQPKVGEIIDNASCTTNCIAPIMEVLCSKFGVEKALMTTIHSYTADQNLVDGPHKDLRRARAAAENTIPTTTGAAVATGKAVPEIDGSFDGLSIRVPTPVVSLADIVAVMSKEVTAEEVNQAFKEMAETDRYRGIIGVTEEPIVSSDVIGCPFSTYIDLALTNVIKGDLLKVIAWYDNEWAYSLRLVDQAVSYGKIIAQL